MRLLKVKNDSPMNVNVATFNKGRLEKCFNHLVPGAVVNIEYVGQDWQDFIVMASEGNKKVTTKDKLNDVIDRSIDSACKHGVLTSKIQSCFGETQDTIFASISLNG